MGWLIFLLFSFPAGKELSLSTLNLISMWVEPGMLRTHSILLPFLGTSNKPDLPSTDSQAGTGASSELCLEVDC